MSGRQRSPFFSRSASCRCRLHCDVAPFLFPADSPYYYPDSATVVFPGGPQVNAHDSPIYPILVSPPSYPPYVGYPAYSEVVYPVYQGGNGVQTPQKADGPPTGPHHPDERVVCQEHVKRIKVTKFGIVCKQRRCRLLHQTT